MNQLEPTYLRYVYDGLSKGSISSNNPTSLPIGLIGLFEDEFPSSMPLVERMSILNRLATWALLKGPVSIEMVAEVLNEHLDDTKALIDTYSKWFNSPEPGKYILYHDRLRTYLLQKLSDHEVQDLNEKLIRYLENVLNSEGLEEAELYALEHLSTHMLIESQMGNNYERLHEFVNHENLWQKQITTSNEYKWSHRAVQYGIKEGARRQNEIKTIESTVNSQKLSLKEENDIKNIIDLFKDGDYNKGLKRLDSFEGSKFIIICLLIIHEFTIETLKVSNLNTKVCEEILEKIKVCDYDFPNYNTLLLFNYCLSIKSYGLNYNILLDKFFNYQSVLFLVEVKNIDLMSLIDFFEKRIHKAYHACIYAKISFRYLNSGDFVLAKSYLKKSYDNLSSYPISYGKKYDSLGLGKTDHTHNDIVFYEKSLNLYLIISKLYHDLGSINLSYNSLKNAMTLSNKLSISYQKIRNLKSAKIKDVEIGDKLNHGHKIFNLLVLLAEYDKALEFYERFYVKFKNHEDDEYMKWEDGFNGVRNNIFNSSSKVILKRKDFKVFKKFLIYFSNINRKTETKGAIYFKINLIDNHFKFKSVSNISDLFDEIKIDLEKLQFGADKFALYTELFDVCISNNHMDFANQCIDKIFILMENLSERNTNFYYFWPSEVIRIYSKNNYQNEAEKVFFKYWDEIVIKNKKDFSKQYNFLANLINKNLNLVSCSKVSIRINNLLKQKDFETYNRSNLSSNTIKSFKFESIFNEKSPVSAIDFALTNQLELFEEVVSLGWGLSGFELKFSDFISLDISPNDKVENLINTKPIYNEHLSNLDTNNLINYFKLHNTEKCTISTSIFSSYSFIATELIIRQLDHIFIDTLISRLASVEKPKKDLTEINKKICLKLSELKNVDELLSIIEKFNFPTNLGKPLLARFYNHYGNHDLYNNINYYFEYQNKEILKIKEPDWEYCENYDKLLFENGFLNVKIKSLALKINNKNDKELKNKLYEIIEDLKIDSNGARFGVNYSILAYLQLANLFFINGFINDCDKCLNYAFDKKNEIGKFDVGYPKYIDMVSIAISIYLKTKRFNIALKFIEKIISENSEFRKDPTGPTFNKDYYDPEHLLYTLLYPLHQLDKKEIVYKLIETIIRITNKIKGEVGSNVYDSDLSRKELSFSRVSYFLYRIGDNDLADKYFSVLSKDILSDQNLNFNPKEPKYLFNNEPNFIKPSNYKKPKKEHNISSDFDDYFDQTNDHFKFLSVKSESKDFISVLYYFSRMNLFFRNKPNPLVNTLISEVIEISDWQRISNDNL